MGIILVYDCTDEQSFNNIRNWIKQIETHAAKDVAKILVGNKCDMESQRQVSTDEGRELAEHYNVRFLETSAKDCKNVDEAFQLMTKEIKSRVAISQPKRQEGGSNQKIGKVNHQTRKVPQQKSGCC